jgi:predicted small metal-binding protein
MHELKRLRCACGWEATGTEDEVVPQVIDHGARLHNMRATREEVLARLEPVAGSPTDSPPTSPPPA